MFRLSAGSTDHGASLVEYGAVIVLVAAIAGALYSASVPEKVETAVSGALCELSGGGDCKPGGTASGDPEGDPESEINTQQYLPPAPGDGKEECLPLCEPEPGEVSLVDLPEPPAHPEEVTATESHVEHDSKTLDEVGQPEPRPRGQTDYELEDKKAEARKFAFLGGVRGLDRSSDALNHYLDGSGDTMKINADDLRKDVPEFDAEVKKANKEIGAQAIADAKKRGAKGPLTFPVSTEWNSFGYNKAGTKYVYDDADWINTLGSWRYSQTGQVTAYPPEEPGGEWTYKTTTRTHVKKYYDWDEDKTGAAVKVPHYPDSSFSERDLWDMHRAGIAREFWIEGSTGAESTEGKAS